MCFVGNNNNNNILYVTRKGSEISLSSRLHDHIHFLSVILNPNQYLQRRLFSWRPLEHQKNSNLRAFIGAIVFVFFWRQSLYFLGEVQLFGFIQAWCSCNRKVKIWVFATGWLVLALCPCKCDSISFLHTVLSFSCTQTSAVTTKVFLL